MSESEGENNNDFGERPRGGNKASEEPSEPRRLYDTVKLQSSAPKLESPSQFHTWMKSVEQLLRIHRLEYLLGRAPNEDDRREQEDDSICRLVLSQGLPEKMRVAVLNAKSSRAMLKIIKDEYGAADISVELFQIKKLCQTTISKKESPTVGIMAMISAFEDLRALGHSITQRFLNLRILSSLPNDYALLINQLQHEMNVENKTISSDGMRQRVVAYWHDHVKVNVDISQINSMASSKVTRAKKPKFQKNQHHWKSKYCTKCKKKGHNTKDCWFNKEKNKGEKSAEKPKSIDISITLLSAQGLPRKMFIIDTGATDHIMPYNEFVHYYSFYNPDTRTLEKMMMTPKHNNKTWQPIYSTSN